MPLVLVTSAGTPPAAETRWIAVSVTSGENTITSSRFHVPPRPFAALHSDCDGPPLAAIFLSLPCAKNPM